jgi:hypothetical protein
MNDINMQNVAQGLNKKLAERIQRIKARKMVQAGLDNIKESAITIAGVTDYMIALAMGTDRILEAGTVPALDPPTFDNVVSLSKKPISKGKIFNPMPVP